MQITTKRLILRSYDLNDVNAIHELITISSHGDDEIMPEDKIAEWIEKHLGQCERGERAVFAITLKKTKELIGSIDLTLDEDDSSRAALGYWMGEPFRNQGFCTEAGKAILKHGFAEMGLQTIYADYYTWNTASGMVMQKLGMTYEKSFEKFVEKWDTFMQVERYVINK